MKQSIYEQIGKNYNKIWHFKERYLVNKGSRASKKSCTHAIRFIYNMMRYYHKYNLKPHLLVVRRYANTNWNSTRAQLIWAINKLGVSHLWKIPKSEHTLTYKPSGQTILFRGFDDPHSITSITVEAGYLCWVWIEEAYQITSEEDFNKLDMSIRGDFPEPLFKQFVLTFNPWSDKHWIKKRFFDTPSENVLAITTNYTMNEFLGEDDLRIFEEMKEKNPKRYRIEGLGEWGISEGLIYSNWKVEDFDVEKLVADNFKNENFVSCNGMDFGYNDPTVMLGIYADKKKFKIWIWYEYYQRMMENRKIAGQLITDGFQKSIIRADSEDPRTINELKLLGLHGIKGAKKGSGSVLGGIQKLQDYEIIIHPSCTNTINDISNYAWEKDRLTDKVTNKPEHDFSHACVAGDTLVHTVNGKRKIKDLIGKNEFVYSYDIENDKIEIKKCLGAKKTRTNVQIYELELEDGQKIKMTHDHKVLTARGYVECKDLRTDDFVLTMFNTLSYSNVKEVVKCMILRVLRFFM